MRRILAVASLWLMAASPASDIAIDHFQFGTPELTVSVGTTVTWTNRDDTPHTVTSADEPRAFASAPIDTGERFSHLFDHAGRFAYFCMLHPHMRAVIVVR